MSKNIVLSGFMASGKTTVGKRLSEITGMRLVDTDRLIVESEGASIADIFAARGEAYFRARECEVVKAVARETGQVIALGGGAVLDEGNVACLKRNGFVYYLAVGPDEVVRRVGDEQGRPLYGDEQAMRRLLAGREERYRASADAIIDTDGVDPEAVARSVEADYNERAGGLGPGGGLESG